MPDSNSLLPQASPSVPVRPRADTASEAGREVFLSGLKLQNLALDRLRAALAREDSALATETHAGAL